MHIVSRLEIFARSALCLLLLTCTGTAFADKTDVVHLKNGDRVTCEIKNLERGRLKASTDSADTIYIEWTHIARVTSPELYVVELEDGSRLQGIFGDSGADGKILLTQNDAMVQVDMQDVIRIDPLKLSDNHIERWDGSVSVGFDATKANNATSLTASFDAHRRAEDFLIDINSSLYSTQQDGLEDSVRANFGATYRRLLKDRWYWGLLVSEERNDEQGIDLRSLGGGGYGRFLIQSGQTLWSVLGGLAFTNEQRAGGQESVNSAEVMLNTTYEHFTYDSPKTSLTSSLTVYPSLTESERVRANLDLAFRRELIKDLFINISFYYTYDTVPPDGSEKDDYGLTTGLAYSF